MYIHTRVVVCHVVYHANNSEEAAKKQRESVEWDVLHDVITGKKRCSDNQYPAECVPTGRIWPASSSISLKSV